MAQCRGMRMGYAPLLALLEPRARAAATGASPSSHSLPGVRAARARGRARFRAPVRHSTPCSDNTTTERFHESSTAVGPARDNPSTSIPCRLQRRAALRGGAVAGDPFLKLPISKLPRDFFPGSPAAPRDYTTCSRTSPWATWRPGRAVAAGTHERGEELLGDCSRARSAATNPGSAGRRRGPVTASQEHRARRGGLPLRGTRRGCAAGGVADARIGPRGLGFARRGSR